MPDSVAMRLQYSLADLFLVVIVVALILSVCTTVLAVPMPCSVALLAGMAASSLFAWAAIGMYRGTCTDNLGTWNRQDTTVRFWISIAGAILTGTVLAVLSLGTFFVH